MVNYTGVDNLAVEIIQWCFLICKYAKIKRYQSVDDWYHGKHMPSLDSPVAISNYFDVSVDELIGRKPA